MIYVSTGGVKSKSAYEVSQQLIKSGILSIELSGGLHDPNVLSNLKKLNNLARFQVHNYFPPPKTPFVLNLASLDPVIAKQSHDHICNSIKISSEIGQSTYSFHAGYLVDPKVQELGERVEKRQLNNRGHAFSLFIERINQIDLLAQSLGVRLLVENNVLSANNYAEFSSDPFLLTTANECIELMQATSPNVSLLIDVAHLKVTSNTLCFDPAEFLVSCNPWTTAYHLSDNDGTSDTNDPVSGDSWFWPYLKADIDYCTIEVYNTDCSKLKQQVDLVSSFFDRNASKKLF